MDFSPQTTTLGGSGDLLPNGTLAFVIASPRELKYGKESGARYADLELTVAEGPFTKRKVFAMVSDPDDANAKPEGKERALGALCRIMESLGVFTAADPASYQRVRSFEQAAQTMSQAAGAGRTIPVEIGIEKGKDGHADKNKVTNWLSPNPSSASFKKFQALMAVRAAGYPAPAAAASAQNNLAAAQWGTAPAPAAPAAQGWGAAPAAAAPPPAASPPPAATAAPAWGATGPDWLKPQTGPQQGRDLDDEIPF
jgi:hypothetical protein